MLRVSGPSFSQNNFVNKKNKPQYPIQKNYFQINNVSFGQNIKTPSSIEKILSTLFGSKAPFIQSGNKVISTETFPLSMIEDVDMALKYLIKPKTSEILKSTNKLDDFVNAAKEFHAINNIVHIGPSSPMKYSAISGELEAQAASTISSFKTISKDHISPIIIKELEKKFATSADELHFERPNEIITLNAKRALGIDGKSFLRGIDVSVTPTLKKTSK